MLQPQSSLCKSCTWDVLRRFPGAYIWIQGCNLIAQGWARSGNQNKSSGKTGKAWPSCPFAELLPLLTIWYSKSPGQQEARGSEIALQLATNVFWVLKAITKKTTVVYKVSILFRAFYVPQTNTCWFLLNILFYWISVTLKGTKCLPWVSACHGLTWQQWIQAISHPSMEKLWLSS